jgi:hypothetical protein
MRIALNGAARRYRMRRFNLEIIAVAFIALVIVFRFISIDWSIFQK